MTQDERRIYLIRTLLAEETRYQGMEIPSNVQQQKRLLRALFNVRMPRPVSGEFLKVQDTYLQEEIRRKGITELSDLTPMQEGLYL